MFIVKEYFASIFLILQWRTITQMNEHVSFYFNDIEIDKKNGTFLNRSKNELVDGNIECLKISTLKFINERWTLSGCTIFFSLNFVHPSRKNDTNCSALYRDALENIVNINYHYKGRSECTQLLDSKLATVIETLIYDTSTFIYLTRYTIQYIPIRITKGYRKSKHIVFYIYSRKI